MTQAATLTIEIEPELKAKLDQLAIDTSRSAASLAAEAVSAWVEHERRIVEDIKAAMAEMETGQVVPHDEVAAELDAIIAAAERRRA